MKDKHITIFDEQLKKVAGCFCFEGDFIEAKPYGSGHINDTYAAYFSGGPHKRYILQRINHKVFRHPEQLMENVTNVTMHLKNKIIKSNGNYLRETLNIVKTRDGLTFLLDTEGNYWRAYLFIEDAVTYDIVASAGQMYSAGKAFGRFQSLLADFPTNCLHESIPYFHHTPKRYEAFLEAFKKDSVGRAGMIEAEKDFILNRQQDIYTVQNLIDVGKLPLRVTHNDTKLNNVMFDAQTEQALCVVDLDTIMPGSLLYDFGDSIRSGANTAAEDEPNLELVRLNTDYYNAYEKGFLEETAGFITDTEIELLPFSAKLMTLECGIRFLTDYLEGDIYFKTSRPGQNLDRARVQFKLVKEIEDATINGLTFNPLRNKISNDKGE